jgi:hypothetical protein
VAHTHPYLICATEHPAETKTKVAKKDRLQGHDNIFSPNFSEQHTSFIFRVEESVKDMASGVCHA